VRSSSRVREAYLGSIMPLLEVDGLHARYEYAPILQGVSFSADAGEIVSMFGRNGAGKTTALRTIMGWIKPSQGRVVFNGETSAACRPIASSAGHRLHSGRSPILCDAERGRESHARAVHPLAERAQQAARARPVFELFPRLRERRMQLGKTLSGGEQQMVGDRPRPGRSPKLLLVERALRGPGADGRHRDFRIAIANAGAASLLLLVEQNVRRASAISSSCCVIEKGRVIKHGVPVDVLADDAIRQKLSMCERIRYDNADGGAAREDAGKKAAQAEAPKWPEQIFQKLREANISQNGLRAGCRPRQADRIMSPGQ